MSRYEYGGRFKDLHDGDTLHLSMDLGFYATLAPPLRLDGIDAPELKTPDGPRARDALTQWTRDADLTVCSRKVGQPLKGDKYGRWLATLFLPDGTNLNQRLVDEGLAVRYDGGKR